MTSHEPPGAPPRYLFVSDQGRVFSCHDEPTTEDFANAAVGIFTLVRLADLHRYGTEETWRPIPPGELTNAEIGDDRSPPFHCAQEVDSW